MNPKSTSRSCWHAGGSIERRSGPISRRRAFWLVEFHLREAIVAFADGEAESASYALSAAAEILEAIRDAVAWRTASGPANSFRA